MQKALQSQKVGQKPEDFRDIFGNTRLHNAVKKSNIAEVEVILKHASADVNVINKVGKTPLFYAYGESGLYLAKLLIERGADLNIRDKEGRTALGCAVKSNFTDIANLIRSSGGVL